MNKRSVLVVVASALCVTGLAVGQDRLLDLVSDKVIGKYQSASCQDLWIQRSLPKTDQEQRLVQFLRKDPTARTEFLNRVAAPIANKMFECGMIP
jgi:hypothetical protein